MELRNTFWMNGMMVNCRIVYRRPLRFSYVKLTALDLRVLDLLVQGYGPQLIRGILGLSWPAMKHIFRLLYIKYGLKDFHGTKYIKLAMIAYEENHYENCELYRIGRSAAV